MLAHTRVLQLDVQGSFDFYTTVVSLDALDSDAVEAMRQEHAAVIAQEAKLTSEQFRQANHVLPLIAHELTHFIDATSTAWGFRHLRLLAAAHRAAEVAEETEFHHYKSLYDHMRSLRLPAYYTVQGPAMHAN